MIKDISVVIAIGGKGSRLKNITGKTPKPLFPIQGIPTLKRAFNELEKYGFKKIIVSTCFKKELFIQYLNKDNLSFDELLIFEENQPLGECGALWKVREKLNPKTLFINGDLIFSINFKKLIEFHERLISDITLVTHPSSHPEDSDMISAPNGTLVETLFHKTRDSKNDRIKPLLGFSGISIFNSSILDKFEPKSDNMQPNLFGYLVQNAFELKKRIYSYNTSEYIKDMGTEKRYLEVSKAIENKLPQIKNYSKTQNALFLDRDNTLIKCAINSYILSINDIEYLDSNIEKIKTLSSNYSIIAIVTNQPQISMGKLSLELLENINNHVMLHCRDKGLLIDTVIWCPHHPHKGFSSEVEYLKKDCFCRKPNPGMLIEMSFQRNIDLEKSLFIGDSINDELAATSSGCNFINIKNI